MEQSYSDFINSITKRKHKGKHLISNSYGVKNYYRFYRKTKPKGAKYRLTDILYFSILREVTKLLIEKLFLEGTIKLPQSMGSISIRKFTLDNTIKDGKVKLHHFIDWGSTLKLWYEDPEAYKDRTLIRHESKECFRIFYLKGGAHYINKTFCAFKSVYSLRKLLSERIKQGNFYCLEGNTKKFDYGRIV